jgi:hypothetical protein
MKDATGGTPLTNLASAMLDNHRRTHTSAVTTTVAVMEYQLERAIKIKMHPLTNSLNKRLFEGYGPLSTFAAKIDIAFALDTISKRDYEELVKISRVPSSRLLSGGP